MMVARRRWPLGPESPRENRRGSRAAQAPKAWRCSRWREEDAGGTRMFRGIGLVGKGWLGR